MTQHGNNAHTKQNSQYLAKAWDDEPVFVLMGRDVSSPAVILEWIRVNWNVRPVSQLREAFDTALEMQEYGGRSKHTMTVPSKLNEIVQKAIHTFETDENNSGERF